MNNDAEIMARWNLQRQELLNLLLEFHIQWNRAFSVSHNCGHTTTPDPEQCVARIDSAWKKIDDLDRLFARYKKTLGEMRETAHTMYGPRLPEKPV